MMCSARQLIAHSLELIVHSKNDFNPLTISYELSAHTLYNLIAPLIGVSQSSVSSAARVASSFCAILDEVSKPIILGLRRKTRLNGSNQLLGILRWYRKIGFGVHHNGLRRASCCANRTAETPLQIHHRYFFFPHG